MTPSVVCARLEYDASDSDVMGVLGEGNKSDGLGDIRGNMASDGDAKDKVGNDGPIEGNMTGNDDLTKGNVAGGGAYEGNMDNDGATETNMGISVATKGNVVGCNVYEGNMGSGGAR
ncbi:unnamed protein product [Dovyalis caffra]|uniref:Uncharacterized protein n=1 Tax=Dovyalis caffra TaxID=77055 RepID=A0AAV1QR13_9ROSI|nr:unnamed protein product [Dovyalis caffra]